MALMRPALLVLLSSLCAGAPGCGGGSPAEAVVSCTLTDTGTGNPPATLMVCHETLGVSPVQAEAIRQACMVPPESRAAGSTVEERFENGPCSRLRALGGCSDGSGSLVVTTWYYDGSGQTSDDVRMRCQKLGQTFITP